MWQTELRKFMRPAVLVLSLMLAGPAAWSEGEQILEEVGLAGQDNNGDGVIVRPVFDSLDPTSTDWVAAAAGRDYRGFAMSLSGTALVQNGTMIQEFTSSGAPGGIQFDCTAIPFNAPKNNGAPQEVTLSDCHSFTPKNDGSILLAGAIRGSRFVLVRHDPATDTTTLLADGTPPIISDMDSDEFADAADRLGLGTLAIGERKKVIFFPQGDEQNWRVISTINGARIDAVTPFKQWVIVVLDDGQLLSIDPNTGTATPFATQNPGAVCGLGNRDPEKFSARATPLGRLYVSSFGCRNVAIYDDTLSLLSVSSELAANPFYLNMPEHSPNGLDWRSGQGGDWGDCTGATFAEGCTYSQQQDGAKAFGVQILPGVDTSFRMFQFVLQDCRHAREFYPNGPFVRPCPIVNCASADGGVGCAEPDPDKQVLNLTKMLINADTSGEFPLAAFEDPDNPPVMTLPAYVRGEEYHPGSLVFNDYVFYTFFAVTDTIFENIFFTQYDLDILRLPVISHDLCTVPGPNQTVEAMNEFANLIVYNRSDYETIDRGPVEGTRGGTVINEFCNRQRSATFAWSAQSVGLEFHNTNQDAYLVFTELQLDELQAAKNELLCDTFTVDGNVVGPLLSELECDRIQDHVNHIVTKYGVCRDSTLTVQQGNSQENCNALLAKIQNLQTDLDDPLVIDFPDATHPQAPFILAPNYEGEFLSRLLAFKWAVYEWMLNAVPPGGIVIPGS